VDFASACLDGGAAFLQVRAKDLASGSFLDATRAIVERATRVNATVVVNDRADIARLAHAAGVHVGQEDLPPRACRLVLGDAALVGRSTHTREQMDAALAEPISYLAIGPVYRTTSKDTGVDPVGLNSVTVAAREARARSCPVVAIGGITLEHAPAVLAAGADAVAVIGDLMCADPGRRVREFLAALT
jgi:thiamine-phosphate pyrophosphorylase